jgi:hypothetical protein
MRVILASLLLVGAGSAFAFSDSGQINPEFDRSDPSIVAWASSVLASDRGPQDYAILGSPAASYGNPEDVLGSMGTPCSLGDGGSLTLGFEVPIVDGPGADFVVFENAFEFGGLVFMEIAFVEVSSNGVDFARLPAICRHSTPMGAFDGAPAENFYNLAGNFVGGTGFDLSDLFTAEDPLVLSGSVVPSQIVAVRIVDVIGDGSTLDALGNAVFDPYPTAFASGGMDLTGVGVRNSGNVVQAGPASFGRVKSLFDGR